MRERIRAKQLFLARTNDRLPELDRLSSFKETGTV